MERRCQDRGLLNKVVYSNSRDAYIAASQKYLNNIDEPFPNSDSDDDCHSSIDLEDVDEIDETDKTNEDDSKQKLDLQNAANGYDTKEKFDKLKDDYENTHSSEFINECTYQIFVSEMELQ